MISHVHTNSGRCRSDISFIRRFMMVTITLMAPMIEEAPMRWTAKIAIGRALPVCTNSGGYMVQPPARPPPGTNSDPSRSVKANGRIQKLKLFMRGSAMSGAPTCIGIIQLASPTKAGMIAPKIMTSPCIVVMVLNSAGSRNCIPGLNSSARISIANEPATKNMVQLKTRYSVPMSL